MGLKIMRNNLYAIAFVILSQASCAAYYTMDKAPPYLDTPVHQWRQW